MLDNFFNIVLIFFISLIPIVIWAYIFSYIDDSSLNKKRFLFGMVGGGLAVVPILYMEKFISLINFEYLNIFSFIHKLDGFYSALKFSLSLEIFLLSLVIISFIFGLFFNKFRELFNIYFKNVIVFIFLVLIVSLLVYLFDLIGSNIGFIENSREESVVFGSLVFNSLKLILFYYLLVAFIEESAKHFNFLQSSIFEIDSIKTGVTYAIFVALGFSLVENILYFNSLYQVYGLNGELVQLFFYRSIFSVMVHVFCSSIVAYYFSKAYLLYKKKDLSFPYLKIFLSGLFMAIFFHMLFDLSITLGFTFIIILYLVGGYLYISSIFYKD